MEPGPFFTEYEFFCPCGKCHLNYVDMDEDFIFDLKRARARAEVPFILTSTIRCIEYNRTMSKDTSSHLKGVAADIACTTSYHRYKIIESLFWVGLTRFGIRKDFIHVDRDMDKPKELTWVY